MNLDKKLQVAGENVQNDDSFDLKFTVFINCVSFHFQLRPLVQ